MTTKNTGGPAFPVPYHPQQEWENPAGMTLRDYFAAKAMQALIAHGYFDDCRNFDNACEVLAAESSQIADAMLKARES
jgi:hypothetical protein